MLFVFPRTSSATGFSCHILLHDGYDLVAPVGYQLFSKDIWDINLNLFSPGLQSFRD